MTKNRVEKLSVGWRIHVEPCFGDLRRLGDETGNFRSGL